MKREYPFMQWFLALLKKERAEMDTDKKKMYTVYRSIKRKERETK